MPWYIFAQFKKQAGAWELLEAINNPRIAEFAVTDYERMISDNDSGEVRTVRAKSEPEAREKLDSADQLN